MKHKHKTGSQTLAQTLANPRNPRSNGKVVVEVPKRHGGKVAMMYFDRDGRWPSHCLLELHPDPETVAANREIYAMWWDGLAAVAQALVGRLKDFELTALP